MRVLATQRLPGPAWDELTDVEIGTLDTCRDDVEALVAPGTRIDDAVLDRFPALRLVANYGVGYDQVDVAACRARGVEVTNTPGVLDAATADLAFALLLATRRRLVEGDDLVRSGRWATGWSEAPFLGREVTGSTLGIVGLGRIGGAMARRAQGFDMRVLYHQRRVLPEPEAGEAHLEYRALDDLMRESDVVSIHAPLTPETKGLISRERLALLRDGATIVNTARGALVDEDALVEELVSGRISAGLDVFVHEPAVPEALFGLANVVLTPHIGSGTVETRAAMTRVVVDNLLAAERGEPLLTPVP
jgi:glyoxylate reductase